jgi:hypothetical protein
MSRRTDAEALALGFESKDVTNPALNCYIQGLHLTQLGAQILARVYAISPGLEGQYTAFRMPTVLVEKYEDRLASLTRTITLDTPMECAVFGIFAGVTCIGSARFASPHREQGAAPWFREATACPVLTENLARIVSFGVSRYVLTRAIAGAIRANPTYPAVNADFQGYLEVTLGSNPPIRAFLP